MADSEAEGEKPRGAERNLRKQKDTWKENVAGETTA